MSRTTAPAPRSYGADLHWIAQDGEAVPEGERMALFKRAAADETREQARVDGNGLSHPLAFAALAMSVLQSPASRELIRIRYRHLCQEWRPA